jgi:hypothetical protein
MELLSRPVSTGRALRALISLSSRRVQCRRLSASPASTSSEAFLSQDDGEPSISYLNLNRGKAKNALSLQILADMGASLAKVRFDKFVFPFMAAFHKLSRQRALDQ